jgi:predicted nucleic acid-binding protein
MNRIIVLDSGPLGLLVHRRGVKPAEECRDWLRGHLAAGRTFIVPAIVHYELRRELVRLGRTNAVRSLDAFVEMPPDRYLPLTQEGLILASELWANARRRGTPTADPHALDVDVILAAQVLSSGLPISDLVVATANVAHLGQFVPAEQWDHI